MNEIRLINANELKEHISELLLVYDGKEILDAIDNAPTVDLLVARGTNGVVIPITRPQGEWYYSCDKGWECNQCRKTVKNMPIDDNKKATYDFCPNCGADMRGEKK